MQQPTRPGKDNSYLSDEIKEVIEKGKVKNIERSTTPSQDPIQEEMEIMSEVLGNERNGRVRGMGLGPTPSTVFGPFAYRKTVVYKDEDYQKLNQNIESQNNEIETLKKQMAQLLRIVRNNQAPSTATPINGGATSSQSGHQH